ncbi:MAG: hypothetical protein H0X62_02680 [Bacteroidetes bacterium]|nr:hypothetical protein [Bacteroidota bacterium]
MKKAYFFIILIFMSCSNKNVDNPEKLQEKNIYPSCLENKTFLNDSALFDFLIGRIEEVNTPLTFEIEEGTFKMKKSDCNNFSNSVIKPHNNGVNGNALSVFFKFFEVSTYCPCNACSNLAYEMGTYHLGGNGVIEKVSIFPDYSLFPEYQYEDSAITIINKINLKNNNNNYLLQIGLLKETELVNKYLCSFKSNGKFIDCLPISYKEYRDGYTQSYIDSTGIVLIECDFYNMIFDNDEEKQGIETRCTKCTFQIDEHGRFILMDIKQESKVEKID